MQPPPAAGRRAGEGRRARRGGARGDPPERPRTAERLRRAGPPPHADLRAGRLPAPALRLHAPVLPGAGLHAPFRTDVPGVNYGLPPFPVPLDCPRPPGRRRRSPRRPEQLRVEEHRRREHALPPRADAQRDRSGARARADRRPRQHDHGLDARLAGRHRGLQPPAVDRQSDRHARQRAQRLPGDEPGSPGGRPERLHVQHPRQARLGRGGHRVRLDPLRPHALALGPRHLLQPGRLRRLRRRHDRRPGDGADDDLRPPDRGGVGPRRAGPDHAAADAGAQRSERLPVRPVAERRRAAADGRDHAHRQPGDAARARRSRRHRPQLRPAGRLPQPGQHRAAGELARRRRRRAATGRSRRRPATSARRRPSAPGRSRPTSGSSCTTRR